MIKSRNSKFDLVAANVMFDLVGTDVMFDLVGTDVMFDLVGTDVLFDLVGTDVMFDLVGTDVMQNHEHIWMLQNSGQSLSNSKYSEVVEAITTCIRTRVEISCQPSL